QGWDIKGTWNVGCPVPSVTPAQPEVPPVAGELTLLIRDNPAVCAWSADPGAQFLTATSAVTGMGDGEVSYAYPPNTSATSRLAQLTVGGRPVDITQLGAGQAPDDEVVYYHQDAIGSVRLVTDALGQQLRRHDFAPFGIEVGPSSSNEGFMFAGNQRDGFGFDYLNARYFAPATDRFTSPDPLSITNARLFIPSRLNRYTYGNNNPLSFVDPTGLEPCQEVHMLEDGTTTPVYDCNTYTYNLCDFDCSLWRWSLWTPISYEPPTPPTIPAAPPTPPTPPMRPRCADVPSEVSSFNYGAQIGTGGLFGLYGNIGINWTTGQLILGGQFTVTKGGGSYVGYGPGVTLLQSGGGIPSWQLNVSDWTEYYEVVGGWKGSAGLSLTGTRTGKSPRQAREARGEAMPRLDSITVSARGGAGYGFVMGSGGSRTASVATSGWLGIPELLGLDYGCR
ncbi:MAG TPA: RHS repeat-associated core domain-containing protein, partial [Pirellulaceae bacterium]|nr:RHS repeat-associated core domain-containing protein [Pirellulaceae bacterium]